MRAFNGTGLDRVSVPDCLRQYPAVLGLPQLPLQQLVQATTPNSPTNPGTFNTPRRSTTRNNLSVHMDEDYDACDLENWFLAIQSADGQVVIPSFHRPGNIVYNPRDRHGRTTGQSSTPRLAARRSSAPARSTTRSRGDTFPDLTPDATRQDHLRRRQRRRRRHRLGLARPRLPRPARPHGQAVQAAVRLHGHRPQRPAAAEHGRQPAQAHLRPAAGRSRTSAWPAPSTTPRTSAIRSTRSTPSTHSSPTGAIAPSDPATPRMARGISRSSSRATPAIRPPQPAAAEGRFGEVDLIRALELHRLPPRRPVVAARTRVTPPRPIPRTTCWTPTSTPPISIPAPRPIRPPHSHHGRERRQARRRQRRAAAVGAHPPVRLALDISGNGRMVDFGNPPNGAARLRARRRQPRPRQPLPLLPPAGHAQPRGRGRRGRAAHACPTR